MRTQVVVIGGGPAGTLLSLLLHQQGVESVVVEMRSREYVMARIRAGVLEHGSAVVLREAGVGERMDSEGFVHDGVNLAFDGRLFRIDFHRLTGKSVVIYGQTEIQKDLYDAIDRGQGEIIDEAADVTLHQVDSDAPYVTYRKDGSEHRIDAEFIAGCDGSHGASSLAIPAEIASTYERIYPFGWLGLLSPTPPVNEELIYNNHERGFALCSLRNPMLSRYYLQCPLDTDIEEWPDDRFWDELRRRLPGEVGERLVTGPSIEKLVTPLRSVVTEPMRHGRLFLAGDAAHTVPPTGAKGLNLAISDVTYLAEALVHYYRTGSFTGLDGYSEKSLRRVWRAVRFSWWMTTTLHRFPEEGGFTRRIQSAELDYLSSSVAAQTAMAENYVGLPL